MQVDKSVKIETLKQAFEKLIDGYILTDLKIMMDIQPDDTGNGGCSIPAAMTIIAAMEMLGTLLNDEPKNEDGRIYLLSFMESYTKISPKNRESILSNYRNKMMHVFFPRGENNNKNYAIAKFPENQTEVIKREGDKRVLSVQVLYKHFIEAVEQLRTEIFQKEDETIIATFFDNLPLSDNVKYKPFETGSNFATDATNQTTKLP